MNKKLTIKIFFVYVMYIDISQDRFHPSQQPLNKNNIYIIYIYIFMATLRSPGLKVKLLVGPPSLAPTINSKERSGNVRLIEDMPSIQQAKNCPVFVALHLPQKSTRFNWAKVSRRSCPRYSR